MSRSFALPALTLSALVLGFVTFGASQDMHKEHMAGVKHAVCVITPTEGSTVRGVVHFRAGDDGSVAVTAEISGLAPNSKVGFHVHEFGDITDPTGKSLGGHYNPEGHEHGLPDKDMRHAGDLGNLEANAEGKATYSATFKTFSLGGMQNDVIGRGVVVHAQVDDGGQPTGNAGARAGVGVIGIGQ